MKNSILSLIVLTALSACSTTGRRESQVERPSPASSLPRELQSLVGSWATVSEFRTEPSGPLQRSEGRATGRGLGQYWVQLEHSGNHFGTPYTGYLIIGRDPAGADYWGVWFDSLSSTVVQYQGAMEQSGKVLTLRTEVPSAERPGATEEVVEVIEFLGPDHVVLTTKAEKDGAWSTIVTVSYRRDGRAGVDLH